MSGLRSVSNSELKAIFSKFSAPSPSGQSGKQITFSSVEDSVEALIMLNHRSVAILDIGFFLRVQIFQENLSWNPETLLLN